MPKMNVYSQLRAKIGKKNYSISKDLREKYGISITTQGLDGYEKDGAKAIRFDVLCGLRLLAGVSWGTLGQLIDEEFLRS